MLQAKKYRFCLICLSALFLFTTCKYPENNRPYLTTAKHRLTHHRWFFHKVIINGIDSTMSHLHKFAATDDDPSKINFSLENFLMSDGTNMKIWLPNVGYALSDNFLLKDKKKSVIIGPALSGTYIPKLYFFIVIGGTWEIKMLTRKDLILEINYNGLNIRFEFKDH